MASDAQSVVASYKALREMQARELVRALVGTHNHVQLEVRRNSDVDAFLAERELTREQVLHAATQVATILSALLNGMGPEEFARERARGQGVDEAGIQEAVPSLTDRFAHVAELFPLDDLRLRAWLKDTSKNEVPRILDWDVSVKLDDARRPAPAGTRLPYATLRLATESPLDLYADHEVAVTLDEEDVAFILDLLLQLQVSLRAARESEGG
jgi:hypothetical protein